MSVECQNRAAVFFENLLFPGKNELKKPLCHIRWQENHQTKVAISKCQNATLEEVAVLKFLKENLRATMKALAEEIGKPERTVKRLTCSLQEKQLLGIETANATGYG